MNMKTLLPSIFLATAAFWVLGATVDAATITVTNLDDSGPGSFRQAIADASDGDVIDFVVAGTITLTTGPILIADSVTVLGPGAANLEVSGNNTSRVLDVAAGLTVIVKNLTVSDAWVDPIVATDFFPDCAGAIAARGDFVLDNVHVRDSEVSEFGACAGGSACGAGLSFSGSSLLVRNSEFRNNSARYGAALCVPNSENVTVSTSTFAQNIGEGALLVFGGSDLLIDSVTVDGTLGDNANGIEIAFMTGNILIRNSTVSNNDDHGISSFTNNETVVIESSTITENGVGLVNYVAVYSVHNSIVANNVSDDCTGDPGAIVSAGFNIESGATCGFGEATDQQNVNPSLGLLSDNGGPTQTYPLLPGSAAIDAGSCSVLNVDQRGYLRRIDEPESNADDACDIGAFEFNSTPAPSVCGDGDISGTEDCDDGNILDGDCCSALCAYESVGNSCDSADVCYVSGTCDGVGGCVGTVPADCSDADLCTDDSCDSGAGCVNTPKPPNPACFLAAKSQIKLIDRDPDGGNRFQWKWAKGELVAQPDLGNPDTTTDYAVCIYDYVAGTPSLATSINTPASGNWRPIGAPGFAYKDNTLSADGLQKAKLKAALAGKSKAEVKAKGVNLPLPSPATAFQFFNADERVTVQLVNSAGKCWSSEFGVDDIERNRVDRFQAKVR
jgi:cysteine-rich repeat protein